MLQHQHSLGAVKTTLLTKFWSKLVKIGRHWSKNVFGQGHSDDQYPKGAPFLRPSCD